MTFGAFSLLYPRQDLRLGRTITLELVCDQHPRRVLQSLEQFAKEAFSYLPVASALYQHIERMPLLADRAPQAMVLAFDGQNDLVQMPFATALRLAPAQGMGIGLPELQGPLPDALVRDADPPASYQLLDASKSQQKSKIQPHNMADDDGGIAESAIQVTLAHPATLPISIPFGKLTEPGILLRTHKLLILKLGRESVFILP